MKCKSCNYLHIYNIKLIEENTQFKKKKTLQTHFLFYLFYKTLLINSTKHVFFFRTKTIFRIQFPNIILFLKNTKNHFLEYF